MSPALLRGASWVLRRLCLRIVQILLVLFALWLGLYALSSEWRRAADDPRYAGRVFEGLVPFDRVIASRQWHARGADPWDCTFAVVALAADAPALPPEDLRGVAWWFRFGGDWKPTPAEPLGDTTRDTLEECGRYFDADTNLRLDLSLSRPGSWYVRDRVGETVSIYAPLHGIAARIRYGD